MKKIFGILQQIGKALMLPVAILPAAGILLGFGNAFQNPATLAKLPFLGAPVIQYIAKIMEQAGGVVFGNLALLFAVGVAVGLADGEGVAAIAAVIGYLIMNVTMGTAKGITADMVGNSPAYASVLGIPTLQTGVFGGIIIGVLAASMYKKYYNMELPPYLGFFAGKRFVPIITAVSSLILGIIMIFAWPPVQNGLNWFSHSMIDANRTLAAFIFGVIERSLIPFGLHHIFYSPFWFEFGEYVNKAGELVRGDNSIFFAQLKDGVDLTAGTFMTGKFPFMMFGLPAAALAMYHEAKPEKKALVGGIMASAALTSFLTGITEPIEFTFLFVAPILYGIHCIFAGLSFMLMHILGVKIGMTFSGGVIDFLLFGVLQGKTAWWLVILVGLAFAPIYYFGFRFAIRKFNLKTPGREDEEDVVETKNTKGAELAQGILKALGGKENVAKLDACITRLRISVNDIKNVDKDELKALGASGVLEVGNNLQAIFGPRSETLKGQIKDIMKGKTPVIEEVEKKTVAKDSSKKLNFVSPLNGKVLDIKDVPDKVFSEKIMGDGFAIEPTDGEVVSPVNGVITTFFKTKHAIGFTADNGQEVLVHFGIDTVNLNGEGFEALAKEGDKVKAGQLVLKVDLETVKKAVPSLITPIVFTNLDEGQKVNAKTGKTVKTGDENIVSVK
ncbi:glucose-specific PTS transporter subunit IIBC [Tepidibacter hydrothermalis]